MAVAGTRFDPAYFDPAFFDTGSVVPRPDRVDPRLIPPSILDARSRAFGEVMRKALAEPEFRHLLMEFHETVDARLLPWLIRENNIQDLVEPGLSEHIVRRLLAASYELHERKGFIDGVRAGLDLLGIAVTSWSQWFQRQPPGAPGTHIASLSIGEDVFVEEGRAITARLQRLIARMIARMQRKSQFIAMRFSATSETPVHVGAVIVSRLRVSPRLEPITSLIAQPPVFVGAAIVSRVSVKPRIAA